MTPRKVAPAVERLVKELRASDRLGLIGEARAALAHRLARAVDDEPVAAVARELRAALSDLEALGIERSHGGPAGEPPDGGDPDDGSPDGFWEQLAAQMSTPVGDGEEP